MINTIESSPSLDDLLSLTKAERVLSLAQLNAELETLSAVERVEWALKNLKSSHAVSSSFGVQSAVMLHLLTQVQPDIPVILTDTGYLFPETYQFIDNLTQQLGLNLKVYRSEFSSNWQEARYGKLWEQGIEGIERYNKLNKVEPMRRALDDLQVGTWFSGLRVNSHLLELACQSCLFKMACSSFCQSLIGPSKI